MDKLQLRKLVIEFAALAADSILLAQEGDSTGEQYSTQEVLEVWEQRPDCHLSTMFIGYALGKGVDVNLFTMDDLNLAVIVAVTGADPTIDFDWLGDIDATSKPN